MSKRNTTEFVNQVPSFSKTEDITLYAKMFFHLPALSLFNLPKQDIRLSTVPAIQINTAFASFLKEVSTHPLKRGLCAHGWCARAANNEREPCQEACDFDSNDDV